MKNARTWLLGLLLTFAPFAHAADEARPFCQVYLEQSLRDQWLRDYPELPEMYAKARQLIGSTDRPTLSVVVPAYREEARIADSIRQIKAFFDAYPFPVEILFRIEKSPDLTAGTALAAVAGDERFDVSPHPVQRGKGYAVRQGMLAGRGDYVVFMDTDLSTPLPEIYRFLSKVADGERADILIGDRRSPESQVARQPWSRRLMGATFQGLIRAVLSSYGLRGINDTQCGFKMFTQRASTRLFRMAQVDGFAFDIEILLLASEMGMDIHSIPVTWRDDPRSTVHPIRDPLRMLRDVIQMRSQVRVHLHDLQLSR